MSLLILIGFMIVTFVKAQSAHLSGTLIIQLEKGVLKSQFKVAALAENSHSMRFLLHENIKVQSVKCNNTPVMVEPTKTDCYDCVEYRVILSTSLTPMDTFEINTLGKFGKFEGKNKKDYKGNIVSNYGILRASEQSKWYPIVSTQPSNIPPVLQRTRYKYDFEVTCQDCENIYVGQGNPQKSGRFVGTKPLEAIMLIAGNFTWEQGQSAVFINMEDQGLLHYTDSLFNSINNYYNSIIGLTMPETFTYAHLPSDNTRWGGFMSYPTIVNTQKVISKKRLPVYLAHEVAHYLFGDVFMPNTRLYWFYLESFAEYFSYKYLLHVSPKLLAEDYGRLNADIDFVRLDQISDYDQITGQHRYTTGAFQLLAIEERIGEEKMMSFIQEVFKRIASNTDGYEALIQSLLAVGVDQVSVDQIENELIKDFDIDQYQFVQALIDGQ